MGFKPIQTAKWKKWLKSLGLEYKRTEGSHEVWDYPDDSLLRPVVFRGAKKEIPSCHVHTNLQTLGIDYKTFQKQFQKV
jgi:predicted RNA binding protein YcfA (HicA-like mRNA interferase family)